MKALLLVLTDIADQLKAISSHLGDLADLSAAGDPAKQILLRSRRRFRLLEKSPPSD